MRHGATIEDGRPVTRELIDSIVRSEMKRIEDELGSDVFASGRFADAERLFTQVACDPELPEFLTLPSYTVLNTIHDREETEPRMLH